MSNPLYESMRTPSPMEMIGRIKSNPVAFIRQAGYNIPDGISSPQQMIQYLLQSRQVPQSQLNRAQQIASTFFNR